jgi:tRNA pseudouridine38-40 synthase
VPPQILKETPVEHDAPAQAKSTRYRLTIAFDGANYQGWQSQKIGTGVQELIESALSRLFPGHTTVHGSSRTDAGVHALGLVAHFDAHWPEGKFTARKLLLAINAWLPEDVRVLDVRLAAPDFHARFDAVGKEYRYFVWNHPVSNPLVRRQAWHVQRQLNYTAITAAARHIVGRKDFRSFRANPDYDTPATTRTITRCCVRRSGPLMTFIIEGDGFLYKMCRGIVGTLVQVGEGRLSPDCIQSILENKDRQSAGVTAPAHGLVLWKVLYRDGANLQHNRFPRVKEQ